MEMQGQSYSAKQKALFGYGAAIICLFSIGFSAAAVQATERAVPDFLLAAFRFATQTIGVAIILLCTGKFPRAFEPRHIPFLLVNTVFTSVYNLGLFAGAGFLPLIDAVGITNTATLVFMAFVCCVAKRPIGLVKIFAILLAILGIFMMIQPGWMLGKPRENCLESLFSNDLAKNKSQNLNASIGVCLSRTEMELQGHFIGTICSVLAGTAVAIYYIVLNDFLADLNALHIGFFTGAFGTILCLIVSLYLEDITMEMINLSWGTWLLLFVHSLCASIDHLMTVVAVSLIGSLESSIVFSFEVIIFMCLQYSLMSSYIPGHKNWLEVMGAIVNSIGALLPPAIDLIALYKYSNPSINDFGGLN